MAVVVWMAWPGGREPEYHGKKLSEWLYLYNVSAGSSEEAIAAVREIGTNALPWLMRNISFEPGKWRQVVANFPQPLSRAAHFRSGVFERDEALHGFHILGPVARPAVPQLTDWAINAPFFSQRKAFAVAALFEIGGPDFLRVPLLVVMLNDRDAGVRERATNELMRIAPEMLTNGVVK